MEQTMITGLEMPLETSLTAQKGLTEAGISVYSGTLTKAVVAEQCLRLKKAFPKLETGFFELLAERLIANGFCDSRFTDAVSRVIDSCQYPQPSIASVIAYDRHIKLFSYEEIMRMQVNDRNIFESFIPVDTGLTLPVWARTGDAERFKLKRWGGKK